MLADALHSSRMFSVAMQRPDATREAPCPVAGLGLIRVSVSHRDGTSHLILQGLARVELKDAVQYRPYRVYRIRPLTVPSTDNVTIDALVAKVRELLQERLDLGLSFPFPVMSAKKAGSRSTSGGISPQEIIRFLNSVGDPEQLVDLVACAVLPGATERQEILETVDVAARSRRLIHFLLAELQARRKGNAS